MNTKAIERIKGYCCEVTQEQWEELVKVADEVGLPVNAACEHRYAQLDGHKDDDYRLVCLSGKFGEKEIPFPDFLAKLRGDEEWTPKAGEMVEVSHDEKIWYEREFIAYRADRYVCWFEECDSPDTAYWKHCRPLRPTITRAEAESKLNARIID